MEELRANALRKVQGRKHQAMIMGKLTSLALPRSGMGFTTRLLEFASVR